jgi:SNF2 family DNA or RNA helicase
MRVYRIGQEKECHFVRFFSEGTLEDQYLRLMQRDKQKIISVAMEAGDITSRELPDRSLRQILFGKEIIGTKRKAESEETMAFEEPETKKIRT